MIAGKLVWLWDTAGYGIVDSLKEFLQMTELIWDGKYKDNKKVSPVRIALPFQTIERVNQKIGVAWYGK